MNNIKELKIGDYFDIENKKTIISKKEENGYNDQYFEEEKINWFVLDKTEDEIILISEKPTQQEICLERKTGI